MAMATRSVVGYKREDGVVRGTYVHNDGYPEHMVDELWGKFQELGFEGMKEWIDKGVEGQGYSTVNSEPYNDGDSPWLKEINDEEYGYTIDKHGIIATQKGKLISTLLDPEFMLDLEHDIKSVETQHEFLSYVKKSMIEEYGVNVEDAEETIKQYNFPEILKASPEFVMHYMPEEWAYKLYEVSTKEGRPNKW